MFAKVVNYIDDKMLPIGFALVILLILFDNKAIMRAINNRKGRIGLVVAIFCYYLSILIDGIKVVFF